MLRSKAKEVVCVGLQRTTEGYLHQQAALLLELRGREVLQREARVRLWG